MGHADHLSALLLAWYDRHRRDLPWRARPGEVSDPYRVWLSEIMLQQTTVAAVGPYYRRFLERFPTVEELAAAPDDDVMRLWAGLGYYSRARNLKSCAETVVRDHGGVFPDTEQGLLDLPGIGPYTAAAIAAIAFGRRANAVDGNIERVVARVFAVEEAMPRAKAHLRDLAARVLPAQRAGDHVQALMDLGATICTPKSPNCLICPIAELCDGRRLGIAAELPRRAPKAERPVRHGYAFFLSRTDGAVLFQRRPPKGLLGGMLEVPGSEWKQTPIPLKTALAQAPAKVAWRTTGATVEHTFTHFHLILQILVAKLPASEAWTVPGLWHLPAEWPDLALPSLMRKVIGAAIGRD